MPSGVPASIAAVLVGCGPEAPSPPPPAEEVCPGIDWAVRLDGPIEDIPEHAIATPDGDVIIAGLTTGSIPVGTGPEKLAPGQGLRDGFVARLAPDGTVRWSRVLGGPGVDQVRGVQLHGDQVWVAGEVEGSFSVDGEALDGASLSTEMDAYGLALRLDDGRVVDYQRLTAPDWQIGFGFAIDRDGRRLLTGRSGYAQLDFAGLQTGVPPDGSNMDGAFLVAWDAAGREAWGLMFQPSRGEAVGQALQVDVEPPLWAALLHDAAPAWSGGVHPALPPDTAGHPTVLSFDGATGQVSGTRFDPTEGNWSYRYDTIQGGFRWYGYATADTWLDGSGGSHPFNDPPVDSPGVVGEVGVDGGVLSVGPPQFAANSLYGGDVSPTGRRVITGLGPSHPDFPLTMGVGTPYEVTLEGTGSEPDGMLAMYDPDEVFRCVWGAGGYKTQYIHDAAFDAEGGMVVVGWFSSELIWRDSDEQTLLQYELGPGNHDGFVLRIAPPSWL